MRGSLVLVSALVVSGCAAKKIPGTDIEDTSDTRAVLDVVNAYRKAVEDRNAQAVIDLADPDFKDDGGTVAPDDDLSYDSMHTALPARLLRLSDVKLDLSVRRIEFDDDRRRARVTYSYQMSFKMPDYKANAVNENDIKQMVLRRSGEKDWRILSGI